MTHVVTPIKKNIAGIERTVEASVSISAYVAVRTVADGVTVSGSASISSATAAFVAGDVGRVVTGSGIPVGATIVSITSATVAVLSAPATASASGVSLSFSGGETILLSELGLRKLFSMDADVQGGLTDVFDAEWDGSRTAPKISLYGDAVSGSGLSEVAAGSLSPAVVVQILARGI